MEATGIGSSRDTAFTPEEGRIVYGLTGLFALRMLGFYLVLPVFAPYVATLPGSTPLLVGLAMGVYGLTQTLFQVPFGAWSDRVGRKPVLTLGLALFALGSVICALADNAWMLVVGRLVQGMGAIASVAVAMLADLTRDVVRTRAMAMIGVAIGGSFAAGVLVGPATTARFGVPSLFWLTAFLTLVGIAYLWLRIPEPPRLSHHEDTEYSSEHAFEVVTNPRLLILDWGTFNLHVCLTAIFVTAPFLLDRFVGEADYWKVFVPILAAGFAVMLGAARISGTPGRGRLMAQAGKAVLASGLLVLAFTAPATVTTEGGGLLSVLTGILLFVMGFAVLEPLFPALLTRLSQQTNRGTAVGIFNMSQFLGAFVGGLVAGFFLERSLAALYGILAGGSLLWVIAAFRLHDPRHLSTVEIPVDGPPEERRVLVRLLLRMDGVEDVAWEAADRRLLVRYDSEAVARDELRAALARRS